MLGRKVMGRVMIKIIFFLLILFLIGIISGFSVRWIGDYNSGWFAGWFSFGVYYLFLKRG